MRNKRDADDAIVDLDRWGPRPPGLRGQGQLVTGMAPAWMIAQAAARRRCLLLAAHPNPLPIDRVLPTRAPRGPQARVGLPAPAPAQGGVGQGEPHGISHVLCARDSRSLCIALGSAQARPGRAAWHEPLWPPHHLTSHRPPTNPTPTNQCNSQKVEETKSQQAPSKTLFVVNFDVMRTSGARPLWRAPRPVADAAASRPPQPHAGAAVSSRPCSGRGRPFHPMRWDDVTLAWPRPSYITLQPVIYNSPSARHRGLLLPLRPPAPRRHQAQLRVRRV